MLQINNFQKGQSQSPYTTDGAFSKSQNLDVFSLPGIARINYIPTAGATSPTDLPITLVRSSASATNIYAIDDSSKVYLIDPTATPHTLTAAGSITGKTVIHWKGSLLGIDGQTLKYWTTGTTWAALAGGESTSHSVSAMYFFDSRNDGKLYIASGDNIDSITEDTDFNPADAATYTVTNAKLTLPEGYWALGLSELGKYLVIAAVKTTSAFATPVKNPTTTYFFWDRAATTVDQIIEIPEIYMTNMISVGGTIFVSGGNRGNIYTLSESGFQHFARIPFDLESNKSIQVGGISAPSMAWWQNMLLVGVSSTDGLYPAGIYGISPNKTISHLFLPSEGLDGSTKDILIGGIYPYDENTLFFGWENDTDNTYGIDKVITSANRQTSYASYFESILYPVGTKDSKKSFDKVEVQLARPLQTGEGVKIEYRGNTTGTYTTLGTQTYATNGAVSSLTYAGLHNLENVQLKISLTTGATTNTPHILEIRCLP